MRRDSTIGRSGGRRVSFLKKKSDNSSAADDAETNSAQQSTDASPSDPKTPTGRSSSSSVADKEPKSTPGTPEVRRRSVTIDSTTQASGQKSPLSNGASSNVVASVIAAVSGSNAGGGGAANVGSTPTMSRKASIVNTPQMVRKKIADLSSSNSAAKRDMFAALYRDAAPLSKEWDKGKCTLQSGAAVELIEMLVYPFLANTRFRLEFFYALPYIIEPRALLERVLKGIDGKDAGRWGEVLTYWIEEHFYYFESSPALMSALLERFPAQQQSSASSATSATYNSLSAKVHELINTRTAGMVESKRKSHSTLDIQLLKVILNESMQRGVAPGEVKIAASKAISSLLSSSTFLVSVSGADSPGGESLGEHMLQVLARKAITRLMEVDLLVPSGERTVVLNGSTSAPLPEMFSLTASSVALYHSMLVESVQSQDKANLKKLLRKLSKSVVPKAHVDDVGVEIPASMTGREMIDWMVANSDAIPSEMRNNMTVTEKMALSIGKKMLDCELLCDHVGAFPMFSATHLYTLSFSIDLGMVRSNSLNSLTAVLELPLSPTGPSSWDSLVDVDAQELADGLTQIDAEFLLRLELTDLDFQSWKKGGGQSITSWINFFNRISYLIATEIVTCPWPDDRKALLEKLVDVGTILLERGNFQSLFSLMGGLTLNAVSRLTSLWEKGVDGRRQLAFQALQETTSSRNNFKEYRTALANMGDARVIPYLGLALQDLLSIEEIPAHVASHDDAGVSLINMERLRKIANVKGTLHCAQRFWIPERSMEGTPLMTYLTTTGVMLDRDTLYALSLKIQSRNDKKGGRK